MTSADKRELDENLTRLVQQLRSFVSFESNTDPKPEYADVMQLALDDALISKIKRRLLRRYTQDQIRKSYRTFRSKENLSVNDEIRAQDADVIFDGLFSDTDSEEYDLIRDQYDAAKHKAAAKSLKKACKKLIDVRAKNGFSETFDLLEKDFDAAEDDDKTHVVELMKCLLNETDLGFIQLLDSFNAETNEFEDERLLNQMLRKYKKQGILNGIWLIDQVSQRDPEMREYQANLNKFKDAVNSHEVEPLIQNTALFKALRKSDDDIRDRIATMQKALTDAEINRQLDIIRSFITDHKKIKDDTRNAYYNKISTARQYIQPGLVPKAKRQKSKKSDSGDNKKAPVPRKRKPSVELDELDRIISDLAPKAKRSGSNKESNRLERPREKKPKAAEVVKAWENEQNERIDNLLTLSNEAIQKKLKQDMGMAREIMPYVLKRARSHVGDTGAFRTLLQFVTERESVLKFALTNTTQQKQNGEALMNQLRDLVRDKPLYVNTWIDANRYLYSDAKTKKGIQALEDLIVDLNGGARLVPRDKSAAVGQLTEIRDSLKSMIETAFGVIDTRELDTQIARFEKLMSQTSRVSKEQGVIIKSIRNYINAIMELRWYNTTAAQRTKQDKSLAKSRPSGTKNKIPQDERKSDGGSKGPSGQKSHKVGDPDRFKLFKAVYDILSKPVRAQDRPASPRGSPARSPRRNQVNQEQLRAQLREKQRREREAANAERLKKAALDWEEYGDWD